MKEISFHSTRLEKWFEDRWEDFSVLHKMFRPFGSVRGDKKQYKTGWRLTAEAVLRPSGIRNSF